MPRTDRAGLPGRSSRSALGGRLRGALAAALVAWVVSGAIWAVEILQVTPLARDGWILVSFEMSDAFTDEVRAAIDSGLTTAFTYDVELRRAAAFWFDDTIDSATVTASVRYDNLTRRFQISRLQDGRVEDTIVTEDEEVVRRRMTKFERLALFPSAVLRANAEYYVRVRAESRPRNSWFFWPWGRALASAITKFTFLP